ncbi:hypothetical protein A3A74_05475 [Candidatus Roizmanbacteria bacterium RIFCSPLOWO2_01_FULL_35_13]|uniref:AB hydrolase-1 domain-containing protein n=1 Tax=Candidatus Roizmanbacteria bacterium RIFCSPLOWO2_01_FULL_35_13 TaxID=1802055 RepID=A0A1F7I959_9BACT|nr:MAG: hypothetical protein A3A74_05475 [Candidatus Roizmanbacteria bacterium RIFCSPLOWO2_01_FULL_35_13]
MHILLLVPGLGNYDRILKFWTKVFTKDDFKIIVCNVDWKKGERNFEDKINIVENRIVELVSKKHEVSVMGLSAGGSIALAAFHALNKKVRFAVTVCSCLKLNYDNTKREKEIFELFPSYRKAVQFFENTVLPELTLEEKKRILTIRPIFDEIVPVQTMIIEGANNFRLFLARHISLYIILFFFSSYIFKFINSHLSSFPYGELRRKPI